MYSQSNRKLFGPVILALLLLPSWVPVAEAQDSSVRLIAPPPAPPPGQWLLCAMEGGRCNVQGQRMVRYGVPGAWVYGTTTTPLNCTNSTFGDPKPGTKKYCEFRAPQPVGGWTRCAIEGGKCNLLDQQMVRYGAPGAWIYGIVGSTFNCTNTTFGDPKEGTRKECYYNGPTPVGRWRLCAIEGGRCNFVGRASVRYGAPGAWVYGAARGGIDCNNPTFGDPKVGTVKQCYWLR
jgi:hypothetical protein